MATSASEVSRGAKRRTVLSGRSRVTSGAMKIENENGLTTARNGEEGCDSGLSIESSTRISGSPISMQRKAMSNPIHIANPPILRATNRRNECDKTTKSWKSRSVADSPCSTDNTRNRQFSLTNSLRTSRNVQSPGLDSGDEECLRVDRDTYQYMFQDIVSIKTILLKLKRVLQESEENSLTRAETLNPFDNSIKNGLFHNLNEGSTADVSTSPGSGGSSIADELADLRRQVIFLQGQVEDRDRTIQVLQFQISKLQGPNSVNGQICALGNNQNNIPSTNTCNAATQTEKLRPGSAGPSLLQTLPQDDGVGPLVSWSDSWNRHCPTFLGELSGNRSPRKSTDRTPRTIKFRQETTSHQQNGHINNISVECPLNRNSLKSKDSKSIESNKTKQCQIKREGSPAKSCILTTKNLPTSTLTSRSAWS